MGKTLTGTRVASMGGKGGLDKEDLNRRTGTVAPVLCLVPPTGPPVHHIGLSDTVAIATVADIAAAAVAAAAILSSDFIL